MESKKVSTADQKKVLEGLVGDYRAVVEEADGAMLDYVVRLTDSPSSIDSSDVDGLRELGFDDRGIHDICSIAAYFAYVNRIADGLGVDLEEGP